MIHVTIWNEYLHEQEHPEIAAIYPRGIHGCIQEFLQKASFETSTATLRMPEHGLTEEVLNKTDVLIWWGHKAHQEVQDAVVQRVYDHVMQGMGLIVLHSGHASKIFRKLCGTESWKLKWREDGETELLWNLAPNHEITRGIDDYIRIPHEEMYGEPFEIPRPDELVFVSWFEGGEVFRSGVCYHRGKGRVFYFRPGHEAFPIYYMPEIQRVIINACRWAARPRQDEALLGTHPERITRYGDTYPIMEIRPNDFHTTAGLHDQL